MATKVLEKRKLNKPLVRYPAMVVDKNIELAFAHRGAYATLLRRDSGMEFRSKLRFSRPYGVVYELSIEDFQKIAEKEIGYEVRDIQVRLCFSMDSCSLVWICRQNKWTFSDLSFVTLSKWL